MEKNPVILGVGIFAMVLLVLGSLSHVVGYQSIKSSVVNDSPLFQSRIQKMTHQQQPSVLSQYLGESRENLFLFPIKENHTLTLKRVIEFISKMDKKTLSQFEKLYFNENKKISVSRSINGKGIMEIFQSMSAQPLLLMYTQDNTSTMEPTFDNTPTLCSWGPICTLILIVELTFEIVLWILTTPILIASFLHFLLDEYFPSLLCSRSSDI